MEYFLGLHMHHISILYNLKIKTDTKIYKNEINRTNILTLQLMALDMDQIFDKEKLISHKE